MVGVLRREREDLGGGIRYIGSKVMNLAKWIRKGQGELMGLAKKSYLTARGSRALEDRGKRAGVDSFSRFIYAQ